MNFKNFYTESFGFDYKFPKNPNEAIADFYAMFAVHKTDLNVLNTLRDEDLAFSLKQANDIIVKGMYKFLLEAVLRACACEIFHFQGFYKEYLEDEFLKKYDNENIYQRINVVVNPYQEKYIRNVLPKYEERWKRIAHMENFNIDEFLNFCSIAFSQKKDFWHSSFGGEAWMKIADAGIYLIESFKKYERNKKDTDIYVAIDHIIDIHHNTGSLFTKWRGINVDMGIINLKSKIVPESEWKDGEYVPNYSKPVPYQKLIPQCSPRIQDAFFAAFKDIYGHSAEAVNVSKYINPIFKSGGDTYKPRKDILPREPRPIIEPEQSYDEKEQEEIQNLQDELSQRRLVEFKISKNQEKLFNLFIKDVLKSDLNKEGYNKIYFIINDLENSKFWFVENGCLIYPEDYYKLSKSKLDDEYSIKMLFCIFSCLLTPKNAMLFMQDFVNDLLIYLEEKENEHLKNSYFEKLLQYKIAIEQYFKIGKFDETWEKMFAKPNELEEIYCAQIAISTLMNDNFKKMGVKKYLDLIYKYLESQPKIRFSKEVIDVKYEVLLEINSDIQVGDYVKILDVSHGVNKDYLNFKDIISKVKDIDFSKKRPIYSIWALDKKNYFYFTRDELKLISKGNKNLKVDVDKELNEDEQFLQSFKVGDKVVVGIDFTQDNIIFKKGETGTVSNIAKINNKITDIQIAWDNIITGINKSGNSDKKGIFYYIMKYKFLQGKIRHLYKVEKNENLYTLKVGNKVKVIGKAIFGNNQWLHKIGEIVAHGDQKEQYLVQFKSFDKKYVAYYSKDSLELVNKEPFVPVFKISDKVQVIGPDITDSIFYVGSKGTISKIDNDSRSYLVLVANNVSRWFDESSLKKAEEEVEFKVGDRVETTSIFRKSVLVGLKGKVCDVNTHEKYGLIGVCFDKKVPDGHSCDGSCPDGHGWYLDKPSIKKLS